MHCLISVIFATQAEQSLLILLNIILLKYKTMVEPFGTEFDRNNFKQGETSDRQLRQGRIYISEELYRCCPGITVFPAL
jgi:hypothetical protein